MIAEVKLDMKNVVAVVVMQDTTVYCGYKKDCCVP